MNHPRIILKDSTMREGLDVPGVSLDLRQKRSLLEMLAQTGIQEVEIIAPGHFARDHEAIKNIVAPKLPLQYAGLIYGNGPAWKEQLTMAEEFLDRVDILIPLSELRPPADRSEKKVLTGEVLDFALKSFDNVGIGFPHATQADPEFVLAMCRESANRGAKRITIYDTNGSALPWDVSDLIRQVRQETEIEICFHAHNDLGMATANAVSSIRAGAHCLDVTVNGLGDRAGNASLEQVAVVLYRLGYNHGIRLDLLRDLSQMVAAMTLVPVSKLAPVVGDFVFQHKSPSHLQTPELFEPFDPALIRATRSMDNK
ncbi:MAG: LeuA family protein [Desulfobulbaceae bacterium]|nr:LeuA family protein [Desulfobulbaceae bacterium]